MNEQQHDTDVERQSYVSVQVELDNDYDLVEAVNADGSITFWLLAPDEDAPHGCNCPDCAPHDQKNPFRTTCGVIAKTTGKPCQAKVRLGERCSAHREAQA